MSYVQSRDTLHTIAHKYIQIEEARRGVRQLRQHYEDLASNSIPALRTGTPQPGPRSGTPQLDEPISPVRGLRALSRATAPPPVRRPLFSLSTLRLITRSGQTKEAQARMEEMQRLIGRRAVEYQTRPRPLSLATEPVLMKAQAPEIAAAAQAQAQRAEEAAKAMGELAAGVESDLSRAAQGLTGVHDELDRLTATLVEVGI